MAIRTYAQLQTDYADNAPLQKIAALTGRNFIDSVHNWVNNAVPATSVTFAGSGGAILGASGGNSGLLTLIASDGDTMTIAPNTSDQMLFAGASGGYLFDDDITVGSSAVGTLTAKSIVLDDSSNVNIIYGGIGSAASIDMRNAATGHMIFDGGFGYKWGVSTVNKMTLDTLGNLTIVGNRLALRTVSNGLANNAAGTVGDIAIGTDGNTYSYIWFATNTPSRAQYATW